MAPDNFTSLKGHFLMAMPSLADPNFKRSVTCISEHTPEGAVGTVINRVHEHLDSKAIFKELGIKATAGAERSPLYIGGPVHTNKVFVLHGPPLDWEDSLKIDDGLALSNSRAILEAIAQDRGPNHFIISLGCAGCGPGQLEWELAQNAWLTLPNDHDILFHLPVNDRWQSAMQKLGVDPDLISETAGNA
jgi:putative transcriptional regulator